MRSECFQMDLEDAFGAVRFETAWRARLSIAWARDVRFDC